MPCSCVDRGTALTSNYKGRGITGSLIYPTNRSHCMYLKEFKIDQKKKEKRGFLFHNIVAYQFLGSLVLQKKAT